MNRYLIVSRLRWPAILLLTGVIALLDQMHVLSWGHAWPLYLILFGVLALAERAVYASQPPAAGYPYAAGYPQQVYAQQGYPQQGYAPGYAPGYPVQPGPVAGAAPSPAPGWTPAPTTTSTGIVPTHTDLELRSNEPGREPRKSWEEEGR